MLRNLDDGPRSPRTLTRSPNLPDPCITASHVLTVPVAHSTSSSSAISNRNIQVKLSSSTPLRFANDVASTYPSTPSPTLSGTRNRYHQKYHPHRTKSHPPSLELLPKKIPATPCNSVTAKYPQTSIPPSTLLVPDVPMRVPSLPPPPLPVASHPQVALCRLRWRGGARSARRCLG